MFGSAPAPDDAIKAQPSSVWVQYADSLLPVTAVFGAIGLLLLGLSLLGSGQLPNGTRQFALIDLMVAAIAALVGLLWRWRRQRSAP
jgi:hypothetical protein